MAPRPAAVNSQTTRDSGLKSGRTELMDFPFRNKGNSVQDKIIDQDPVVGQVIAPRANPAAGADDDRLALQRLPNRRG